MHYKVGMKPISYTRAATKTLKRMPANTSALIISKIEQYAADPAALANRVVSLKGREGIRLRVGDWRVIMDDGVVLAVLEIGPRGSVYE
jgi:mRNA interferase RelE/StbE